MYKASETFSSCLTKWVDRLLPFELTVVRTPGRTLGEADYLSRLPSKSINVVTEFANVLDEAITAKGKKPKQIAELLANQKQKRTYLQYLSKTTVCYKTPKQTRESKITQTQPKK